MERCLCTRCDKLCVCAAAPSRAYGATMVGYNCSVTAALLGDVMRMPAHVSSFVSYSRVGTETVCGLCPSHMHPVGPPARQHGKQFLSACSEELLAWLGVFLLDPAKHFGVGLITVELHFCMCPTCHSGQTECNFEVCAWEL